MSNVPKTQAKWDPWKMFDISEQERELIKRRQALVKANKEKFRELVSDPKTVGRGGWILDPAVQRWYTARATRRNYFKSDSHSTLIFLGCVVIPMAALYYFGMKDKKEKEQKLRTGQIKMMDRWTRFHY